MSITVLQQSSVVSFGVATSVNITFPGNRTAGSLVVVLAAACNGNFNGATLSANDGTAFTTAQESVNGLTDVAGIYYRENVSGGSNPTIVLSQTGSHVLTGYAIAVEVGSAATSSSIDQTANGQFSSTGLTASIGPTSTLAQADEIVFAAFCGLSSVAGTGMTDPATSGYTTLKFNSTSGLESLANLSYKIVAATTAVSASTGTLTNNTFGAYVLATFKGVSSGVPCSLLLLGAI